MEITDDAFYATSGPGTVPLIILATAANKQLPNNGGIAPYSTPDTANNLYLATSQRDLLQNFGNPQFTIVEGTPVQGDELNEYGLFTAYSYMGIANRCYVLRADIDTAQLAPSTSAPVGAPVAGTYWLDLSATQWGVFQSNGNPVAGSAWVSRVVTEPTTAQIDVNFKPLANYGNDGDFSIVTETASNYIFEKINGTWYQIGTQPWTAAHPTDVIGTVNPANLPANTAILINGSSVALPTTGLAAVAAAIVAANVTNITALVGNGALIIRNTAGGVVTLANGTGTPLATLGLTAGTTNGVHVVRTSDAQYPTGSRTDDVWVKGTPANRGANWVVRYYNGSTGLWTVVSAPFYAFNSLLADGSVGKDTAALAALYQPVTGALYVGYDVATGDQQLRRWNGTQWAALVYEADATTPTTLPQAGTYWYNADVTADIMVGNGTQWVGYNHMFPETDPNGVIIDGSAPTLQTTGGALVDNDLWIDSSDTENYPALYRFSTASQTWNAIDNTDGTSPFGIIYADARADSGPNYTGSQVAYGLNSTLITDLIQSNYVDPDCPDPRLHPSGMLLFNTRYSQGNVKVWNPTYFKAGGYDPNTDYTTTSYNIGTTTILFPPVSNAGRWVTASGNMTTGAPYMLRKAQRAMIVRALAASVTANQDIRSELVFFNLVAAPGYPELLANLIDLNTDQHEVALIISDPPIRLASDGTSISNWAKNANNAATDGEDGLVSSSDYAAVYYPWGLGTDLSGNSVMIPSSSIALNVIAYSDQVSFPWFAPAGFTRGLVTNATSVGYLSTAGRYVSTILNQGQRDVLYTNNINPIAYIPNRGLVVYGQKTLAPVAGALDRVNVARLANYLYYNLDIIVKPYLFEQNDAITRAAAAATVSSFFNQLVGSRAISDYAVVCDTSNNTPELIDQNQLWIDAACIPLKAVEFIYVPVRLLTTGASLTGGSTKSVTAT